MGTALEGDPTDIFALAAEIHAPPSSQASPRPRSSRSISAATSSKPSSQRVQSVRNLLRGS